MPGPASITIIRHGHRVDHYDAAWKKKAERPHDSPLTQEGKEAAERAGAYTFQVLSENIRKLSSSSTAPPLINLDNFIIMSSPLIRTIETSHAFAQGFEKAHDAQSNQTQTQSAMRIPIHLEVAMIEPAFWMTHDLQHAGFHKDKPFSGQVHHPADFLRETVSPRVRVHGNENDKKDFAADLKDDEKNQNEEEKEKEQEQEGNGSPLIASPILFKNPPPEPLFITAHTPDPETGGFADVVPVEHRFAAAAQALLTSKHLEGKHVLLVGHGASTIMMYNALYKMKVVAAESEFEGSPDYTGLAILLNVNGHEFHNLCSPFTTPHDQQVQK